MWGDKRGRPDKRAKSGQREESEGRVDHEAEFREYMVSRWGGLVRFAYGLTGDRGHAEDLAQTALAKVRRRTRPGPECGVRTTRTRTSAGS